MIENYKYTPLHVHSEYSNQTMLDALNKIPQLVDYCVDLGLHGMALTDHETIAGAVKYLRYYEGLDEEVKKNFKPIIGDEIYLVDEVRQDKMYHFLLLAKDKVGFDQLKKISTTAWSNSYSLGFATRRPIKKDELSEIIKENPGHIVATTACLGGEFPTLVNELLLLESAFNIDEDAINTTKQKIVDFIVFCVDLFGKDNFFIEVQPSDQMDQVRFNSKAKELARVFGLEMVITTDAHYLTEDHRTIHTAFLSARDASRDSSQFYKSAYVMQSQDMMREPSINGIFSEEELIALLDNTNKIADMCEYYNIAHQQEVPYVDRTKELAELIKKHPKLEVDTSLYPAIQKIMNEDNETNLYWWYRIYDFLKNKDLLNHTYVDRINTEAQELHDISKNLGQNLFSYYVTMTKIQEIAWDDADSMVGVSRGSVAGYLSAYALEIQGVDSIKYDLPHWRLGQ